jgi:hypothetical protein
MMAKRSAECSAVCLEYLMVERTASNLADKSARYYEKWGKRCKRRSGLRDVTRGKMERGRDEEREENGESERVND